jgi:ketosteroid isomerase-like protein
MILRRIASAFRCAALPILAIVLSGCNTDPQTDAESVAADLAAERETLMALERNWSDMYGQGDVDGIAALLAKESILLAPGHSPAVGRDDVVALTRALMDAEAADGVSVSWEPQDVFISSSGDMAFDYGRATSTLADGSVIEGSYLVVWIKEDGEWKAAADIFN